MTQEMHTAYQATQKSSETVRETEARALLNCASRLEEVRSGNASREEFGNAIRHNQKLWTVFQVALCEPENPLPRDLKILLLNLSRYVDKVSFRAINEENPELLRSLININRTIAAGLAKKTTSSGEQSPTLAAPPVEEGHSPVMTSA